MIVSVPCSYTACILLSTCLFVCFLCQNTDQANAFVLLSCSAPRLNLTVIPEGEEASGTDNFATIFTICVKRQTKGGK